MSEVDYEGVDSLVSVRKNFFFGNELPRASFPAVFAEQFDSITEESFDDDKEHFLVQFPDGPVVCYFETIFDVQGIRMQNGIIAESAYAPDGAVIMPSGYYAFGSAYDASVELRLMVNLVEGDPSYGKIFAWALAHDPIGQGDNTRDLGLVADSLNEFIAGLDVESALQ